MKIILVILGASFGATARYLMAGYISSVSKGDFPWGTLAVNLAGCLAIGLLWAFAEKGDWSMGTRAFVFVGVLGGYTTFSSFGLETMRLFQDGLAVQALLYVLLSNILGVGLVWTGYAAARHI